MSLKKDSLEVETACTQIRNLSSEMSVVENSFFTDNDKAKTTNYSTKNWENRLKLKEKPQQLET